MLGRTYFERHGWTGSAEALRLPACAEVRMRRQPILVALICGLLAALAVYAVSEVLSRLGLI